MARTLCTLPALLMLLLIPGCEGKSCSRKDVDASGVWIWSHWSFDVTGCTSLDLRSDSIGADGARALAVVQKARLLGLYAVFQEQGIASDALARAVQWCTDMGAAAAEDLSYLRREEIAQLVKSLGLPIIKQRKLVEKLAAAVHLAKDEV